VVETEKPPLGPSDLAKARRVEKVVPLTKMVPACTTQVIGWIGLVSWVVGWLVGRLVGL
jgi:hypothetical protein